MKLVIKKYSFSELLGLISFSLFLLFSLLNTSFYAQYIPSFGMNLIIGISFLILGIKEIVNSKFNLHSIASLILVVLMYIIIARVTGYTSALAVGVVFIYGLRDIQFSEIAKISLIISAAILFLVIISSKLGIITDYVEFSGSRIRRYIGFRYSLYPSTIMMNIIAISFFLKQEKASYFRLSVLFISSFWIYSQTDSRMTFISSSVFLLLNLLLKWFPFILSKSQILLKSFSLTYFINAIISYIVVRNYLVMSSNFLNNMFYALNRFLGGRIYLANRSLNLYGYKLFGQEVEWVGNGLSAQGTRNTNTYLYVDNLYIQILQRQGLLVLIVILSILTATLMKLLKLREYVLVVILIVMSFHSLIDDLTFNLYYNIFWLLIGTLMFKDYKFTDEKR